MGIEILFSIFLTMADSEKLESRFWNKLERMERVIYDDDERNFGVRLVKSDKTYEWLERPQESSLEGRILREKLRTLTNGAYEGVYFQSDKGVEFLGISPRQYSSDYSCRALARIYEPTPLSQFKFYSLGGLLCGPFLTTRSKAFEVMGRDDQDYARCSNPSRCSWTYSWKTEPEAQTQVAAFTFLNLVKGRLFEEGIHIPMKALSAESWAFESNRSLYDAEIRTFFFGSGNYLDALDGFVVVHEWGHAAVDDLNPGLWGYESQVIHEALADFTSSFIFNDSCLAPFDAQESGQLCLRDLSQRKVFPFEMTWMDPHRDSLILSSALWELRKIISPGVLMEMIFESILRLPKNPTLVQYWAKLEEVYERFLSKRVLLEDRRMEMNRIGIENGLSPQ